MNAARKKQVCYPPGGRREVDGSVPGEVSYGNTNVDKGLQRARCLAAQSRKHQFRNRTDALMEYCSFVCVREPQWGGRNLALILVGFIWALPPAIGPEVDVRFSGLIVSGFDVLHVFCCNVHRT
jgi:hypothetical protein